MTREELLKLVNAKVDTTKFVALSTKTIEEELDEALGDIGEDEAANDKVVEKLAKRLKRMDGNVHTNVSAEMRKNKEEEEQRRKSGTNKKDETPSDKEDESSKRIAELEEKINSLIASNLAREEESTRKTVIAAVKSALKDKFEKANLEMNDFFIDTAISKLDIPKKDADVNDLVSKAESIYTSDYKRATGNAAIPSKGSSTIGGGSNKIDEHEWDDIKSK